MTIRVPMWSHMVTTSYLGAVIGPDDGPMPFSEIWPKAHDGLYMASTWDRWTNPAGIREPHPWAIDGPAKLTQLAALHAADGRNVRPWCVVSGLEPEAEGQLAAQMAIAAAAGNLTRDRVIIIDLEPYYHGGTSPQFWRSDRFSDGPSRARRFLDAYQAAAGPGCTAWIAGDVRSGHLAPVSYDVWAAHPVVSLHTPQTYYTIFDGNPATPIERARLHIDRANAILAGYGVEPGRIGHILPAEGDPGVLIEAFRYCHSLGQQRPSLWQRVNITREAVAALAAAPDPWGAPAENPPPPPVIQGVGRETRIIPVGQPVAFVDEAVARYTDRDDERTLTIPVTLEARVQIVRE